MNIPDLPEFNLEKEANDECKQCHILIPSELHFIQPMFIGDRYIDVCPKCARGIRNLLMKFPKTAMYSDSEANRNYYRFISWLEQRR